MCKGLYTPKRPSEPPYIVLLPAQKTSKYVGQIAQYKLAISPTICHYMVDVTLLLEGTYMIQRNTDTRQNNRAVGYVRRSTDRQEQSISDQKNALEAYAAEHGLRFLRFYVDDAISGTSTLGRRAFRQMIKDAESSPRM